MAYDGLLFEVGNEWLFEKNRDVVCLFEGWDTRVICDIVAQYLGMIITILIMITIINFLVKSLKKRDFADERWSHWEGLSAERLCGFA